MISIKLESATVVQLERAVMEILHEEKQCPSVSLVLEIKWMKGYNPVYVYTACLDVVDEPLAYSVSRVSQHKAIKKLYEKLTKMRQEQG